MKNYTLQNEWSRSLTSAGRLLKIKGLALIERILFFFKGSLITRLGPTSRFGCVGLCFETTLFWGAISAKNTHMYWM